MGKISAEELRKAYIRAAKRVFYQEMAALEQARIREVSAKLGITTEEVRQVWNVSPKS